MSENKFAGKMTKKSSLSQVYSLAFDKGLTRTIRFSGNVRASQNKVDLTESSSIDPSFFLDMNNEYFNSALGYQINDRFLTTGNRINTTSKNATFSTAPAGFPSLRLNYNELQSKDRFSLIDTRQSYINASTDYTIKHINLLYNYANSTLEDTISQIKQENPTHLGAVSYNNSFFDNRLNINTNLGVTKSTSKNISLSGTPQTFPEKKDATNGLYAVDTLPGDGQLTDYPSLIDDSKSSDTGIDLNGSYRNIGLKLKNTDTINTIYLYVDTSDDNIANMNFGWNIYYSNETSGLSWSFATVSSSSYDEVNKRFKLVLSVPVNAIFFKAVNTTYDSSAQKISVTEIEAIGSISKETNVTVETINDRQYGGMNLSLRPTKKTGISYNINYDQSKQSPADRKDTNINQGVVLSYAMSKYASFFLNYQSQKTETTLSKNIGSNNYTFSISTNPMETINGSAALSHFESLFGDNKTSETNSGNINMFLNLYSGIDLGTGFTLSNTDDISRGTKTTTNSVNGNLTLIPRNSINILIDGTFSSSTSNTGRETSSSKSETLRSTISITPSRFVNLVANIQHLPEAKQNYSINTRLPGSLQVNINYNVSETGAETLGGSIYWNISRYLYIYQNAKQKYEFSHRDTESQRRAKG
ncbi:MAG: hypothetical protein HY096_12995 [Nitrospinae bacterium]|nr:hypothetical protein [Nitrospinota bacterium]